MTLAFGTQVFARYQTSDWCEICGVVSIGDLVCSAQTASYTVVNQDTGSASTKRVVIDAGSDPVDFIALWYPADHGQRLIKAAFDDQSDIEISVVFPNASKIELAGVVTSHVITGLGGPNEQMKRKFLVAPSEWLES